MGRHRSTEMLIFLVLLCVCISNMSGITFGCIEKERQALLNLKQSFQDPSHKLSSWQGQDCCQWKGVACNQTTGHVVKLHLRSSSMDYPFSPYSDDTTHLPDLQANELSSNLLELQHLNYLDLSGNNFSYSKIPNFFGSMKNLKYLNLSHAYLGGLISLQFANLTSLQVLDLRGLYDVSTRTFQWASNLLSLQYLDMNSVSCSNASDLMQVLTNLPSLSHISLSVCGLNMVNFPWRSINSTFSASVRYLDLSGNHLESSILNDLKNLTSLEVLDLSFTFYATSSSIPTWLGDLKSLVYLNLASNNYDSFEGEGGLLYIINNACSLKVLDLSFNKIREVLEPHRNSRKCVKYNLEILHLEHNEMGGPLPDWSEQLKFSRYLGLSQNLFHGPIPSSIGKLSFLKVLDLSVNQLIGSFPESLGRLSVLKRLDLSSNNLNGVIPETLGKLSVLKWLELSSNNLSGVILETLGKLSVLKWLHLSSNNLSGVIPETLGKLSVLKWLHLSSNNLNGVIPETLGKLSVLEELYLSYNNLNGVIPETLGKLSVLEELYLSYNNLNGVIPKTLGKLSLVRVIDLSRNQLNGSLPKSIGKLEFLQSLDISSNLLEGIVSEDHFANLTRLVMLLIDSNNFSCQVNSNWIPPFSLYYINMASCKVVGSHGVPQWLQTQREVFELNLSNANIIGTFPKWLQNMSSISSLDLSMNQISGHLPVNIGSLSILWYLYLGNNLINGSLPESLCELESLQELDLSRNKFSGILPNCWRGSQTVDVINLSHNKLSGTIPSSMGNLSQLSRLHMNNNNFNGELPLALRGCSEMMLLDLGDNNFSGPLPTWIGGHSFRDIIILRLRKNMFSGSIPLKFCKLLALSILDLANNNLRGEIPHCFGKLTGMMVKDYPQVNGSMGDAKVSQVIKGRDLEYTKTLLLLDNLDLSSNKLVGIIPKELCLLSALRGLNLSHNHLLGNIPNNIEELKSLESLDLSNNKLFGEIPQSMSKLLSLDKLDLSYNNLSGKIPTGPQLQTLNDPNIYAGNDELCGTPLPKKCFGDDDRRKNAHEDDDDYKDSRIERIWFYSVVTLGYAAGLWGVIGSLVFNRNWRHAFFLFH
ncbi:receptor-like protein EIX2 [Humulus lupulus]|uniref:receptor-like protein EIX2 n=1 Tax=Humulus lupulus TaxID=3486 RepID=UPI002B411C75|nr:receptor-like protein EIX2 [Humulus lupulus]XP_062076597.1 receptor-like protein EIX2 [Humulus lupulus]